MHSCACAKLEALGELVGGIAHDLNNTLLPVTMLVPALRKSAHGRVSEGLEIIGSAARPGAQGESARFCGSAARIRRRRNRCASMDW